MTPFYEESVRVEVGEGYVVAPIETLEHIASVYRELGDRSDDPQPWYAVAKHVEEWLASKGFYPEDYEDDLDETFEEVEDAED